MSAKNEGMAFKHLLIKIDDRLVQKGFPKNLASAAKLEIIRMHRNLMDHLRCIDAAKRFEALKNK